VDALIGHPDVEAVDVATAFETHRGLALRAAAGRHVLCRKPLAPTYEDAAAIVEGCHRAGVRLMVNENWRWRPWYRTVREVLDRGATGRPFALRLALRTDAAVATSERPPEQVFAGQAFLRTMNPLVLMELGPHHVDVVRYHFGDPRGVRPHGQGFAARGGGGRGPGAAGVPGPHGLGGALVARHRFTADRAQRLHPDELLIQGTEGSLAVGGDGQVRLARRDGRREAVAVDTADAHRRSWRDALAHFAACLASGAPFETSGQQNLATLRLKFDAYESARTGQPVRHT
jgi:predicted dehydrogenase